MRRRKTKDTVNSLEKLQDGRDHLCDGVHGGVLVTTTGSAKHQLLISNSQELSPKYRMAKIDDISFHLKHTFIQKGGFLKKFQKGISLSGRSKVAAETIREMKSAAIESREDFL